MQKEEKPMNEENELLLLKEIRDCLKNPNNDIEILKASDISRILKINMNQACNLFKRPDFPALCNCRR